MLIRAILLLLLTTIAAFAQPVGILPTSGGGAAPGYIGPGDLVPGATEWCGLRAYNAAYATGSNNAILLLRASDSTTQNIVILTTGDLDVSTAATFCSATTCTVKTCYSQTGSGHTFTQPTAASQPTFVFNCLGVLPCMQFTAGTISLAGSASFTPATGETSFSATAERVSGAATGTLISENAGFNKLNVSSTANQWYVVGDTSTTVPITASTGAWHVANAVVNGASSVINLDGTEASGPSTGNTTAGTPRITGAASTTFDVGEAGFWDNLAFNSGARLSLCHNSYKYWGTSTAC